MFILSIDTSCDDTCISIIKSKKQKAKSKNTNFEILSNVVSSQVKVHARYGGIVPYLAKREHQKNLAMVFKKTLAKSKIQNPKIIDFIAVTIGPGLEPCLWQGINFAKNLANDLKKPIVPVNHLEGHILANFLKPINKSLKSKTLKIFPAVGLVVSGGHTELFLMKNIGKYKLLGETRDDAAGECLDKIARILNLEYPGGPAIAQLADQWKLKTLNPKLKIQNSKPSIKLPRPMIYQKNYDFSFSGLKTAVLYLTKKIGPTKLKDPKIKANICFEVQQAIIDVLISKTIRAAKEYKVKSILIGGGVSANKELRKQFKLKLTINNLQLNFLAPPKKFCTDNAAMIGIAGYFGFLRNKQKLPEKIKAKANLML